MSKLLRPVLFIDSYMLVFLWCVPRSVSTAFEKMIWYSGLFKVISVPTIDLYKQSQMSKEKLSSVERRIESTFNSILAQSNKTNIFVKDMAYHAEPFINTNVIQNSKHVFLTRNPKYSIPSLYKMRTDFSEDQPGFEGQLKLLKRVERLTNRLPLVIDANDLTSNPKATVESFFNCINVPMPKGILSWPSEALPAWSERKKWHIQAEKSTEFENRILHSNQGEMPDRILSCIEKICHFI